MRTFNFEVEDIDNQISVVSIKAANELQAELLVRQEVYGWIKTERYFGGKKADYILGGE